MWFRSKSTPATAPSAPSSRKAKKRRSRRPAERLRPESLESRCLLTFIAPVSYASADANYLAGSLAAGDFANNGIQDLVVGGQNGAVNLLVGNGDGTFKPAQSVATGGGGAVSVAVGDLTGDGKLDIVAANIGVPGHWNYVGYNGYYVPPVPGSVSVLMGNGDGTFQAPLSFTLPNEEVPGTNVMASQYPVSVALGDMNHDGHLDLVVAANYGEDVSSYVDVLLGHGDGTFTMASATAIPTVSRDTTISLDDFNRDGNIDVAVPVANRLSVAVMRGNGDGTLAAPTYVSTGVSTYFESVAVGDVNGDGKLDLITASYGSGSGGGTVSVLLGNGDGSFQAPIVTALPGYSPPGYSGTDPLPLPQRPQAVVVGDLNHDGKLDVAVTSASSYQQYTGTSGYYGKYYNTIKDNNVNVLLGNGDGTFTDAQTVPVNAYDQSTYGYAMTASAIIAANFNGDSFPDLTVADAGQNAVSVLLNGANWSTAPQASALTISGFPSTTTAGTPGTFTITALNADGTVDTSYTGTVRFSSSDGQALVPAAYTFTAADAGTHTFNATLKTAGTQSITATDTSTGTVTGSETGIAVSPAAANQFAVSAPASSTAGSAVSVTVTALDPYNNVATGYAGTVHFTSSDGQASLASNYTFTAGDTGVHTFTSAVTLKTAGNQTVTTTDTTTNSITGGTTVAVNAAAASTMVVSGFPSPITAGVSGSFMVTLKDAYGNVATGYTGTVHFASSDAKAVLPGNYTFTSADAGKHTFSATLKTAGTQSITATDTVNASLHSTDSGITLKPAAASKFVLGAPASVQPGVPFSLTITVEDAYGNIVTGYTGTIHFTSSDSLAHLPANYTFKASDNGVHTFTGLVLKKAGNQTITVTDTKNSSITGKAVVDVL